MISYAVSDWDDAYANGPNVPDGGRWPDAWAGPAKRYRETLGDRARLDIAYGEGARNTLDLFLPEGEAQGLVVFIHGGYWKALDKSFWSHLAAGANARGHAVAIPSYTLCPETRIAGITQEIGAAVTKAAGEIDGPIRLTGHSAGGHLTARMVAETSPLGEAVRARIVHALPIAGVHDLRPIMRTEMNEVLGVDEAEALAESPALLRPIEGMRVTAWVGGAERAEFVRLSALLANVWTGLGARTAFYAEPDKHHFTVVDSLAETDGALTRALFAD
ncbi:MAG: alpha/beta hydrolase [Mesorhizobium amorphae]|nr:MAG: alpha/beta hydrolase [Mesorhizobium amorphae]